MVLQNAIEKGLSRLDAEILLANVIAETRIFLYSWPMKMLAAKDVEQFNSLVMRRLAGEPTAYIIGKKEFWSLTLDVNSSVLIPRPETELLVETTLKLLPNVNEPYHVLELGTGSGAIALALASERPHWTLWATDISIDALAVAKENARKLSLQNVNFYSGDWFEALKGTVFKTKPLFDAIISNPPYISESDAHLLNQELSFEPLLALKSEQQGLKDLKKIIQESTYYLLSKAWLLVEHGYDQADAIMAFFKANNYVHVHHYKDLATVNRVTVGQKP